MKKISVIDAPCGSGKTSWAIQYMREHPDDSFIYCTPYLSEMRRIRESCRERNFYEPKPYGMSKLDNFNELLSSCYDIVVTHTTFLNATPETLELIRIGGYTLIVDEALDVVVDLNETQKVENNPKLKINKDDITFMLDRGLISIENNKVHWIGKGEGEHSYSEVQRCAELGRLYCIDEKMFLTVFPPEMFELYNEVYVLTYLFESSVFKYYSDFFGIGYEKKTLSKTDSEYAVSDYTPELDRGFRERCKELIHICDNRNMNNYKGSNLSKTWYDNTHNKENLTGLKNNIGNYFTRYVKDARASNGDIMWTCFEKYKNKLKGKGYTTIPVPDSVVESIRSNSDMSKTEQDKELELIKKCFVSCNERATNRYSDRWALAYCVNMYANPMKRKFFTGINDERIRNGLEEIQLNDDLYALSCLIQWMFRSRIRKGQPIEIYIPSTRMRGLLIKWLECEI